MILLCIPYSLHIILAYDIFSFLFTGHKRSGSTKKVLRRGLTCHGATELTTPDLLRKFNYGV